MKILDIGTSKANKPKFSSFILIAIEITSCFVLFNPVWITWRSIRLCDDVHLIFFNVIRNVFITKSFYTRLTYFVFIIWIFLNWMLIMFNQIQNRRHNCTITQKSIFFSVLQNMCQLVSGLHFWLMHTCP